ncbi:hypothetical protein CLV82_0894 [Zeaxanthinibacter enoshimensis]|uniref:Uncharacterized protein n=2 Tax=Zeaxanthinibacter enoshimensis TaxID=392009 RepID=A0A4R6TRA9_9FLAO|nr:hypothetical protein CLV82_0894 [Zeaxanthinibacter enoshimensis]
MAIIGLLAALIGFSKTFFIPVGQGTFSAPAGVHIHGFFAFSWIFLFVIQPFLIHFGKFRIHQILGVAGIIIAFGVAITMVPAGLFQVHKELAQGLGPTSYSTLLGVITSGLLFLGLVLAGIYNRDRPEHHKRYMLLATIVVLWPAWFRFRHFFPQIPYPEIWFALVLADSLIIIAWAYELYKYGKLHPVLKYAGLFVIVEQVLEILLFDSSPYRKLAIWIYGIVS